MQNSTVEIVDLICDGEISFKLNINFAKGKGYSQKEIKFEDTLQYTIKGSDLLDGMVADLGK